MGSPIHLPLWAVAAAAAGGTLWAVKSLSILLTGRQPDYTFELAPLCFGVAIVGVAGLAEARGGLTGPLVLAVAWFAAAAGGIAAASYIVNGDSVLFGPAVVAAMLATLGVLLYCGRSIWRRKTLGAWSVIPWALPWLMIGAVPAGGVLESLDERLLEVPLLAVGLGWIALGAAGMSAFRARQSPVETAA
jgi:hypothetical protein